MDKLDYIYCEEQPYLQILGCLSKICSPDIYNFALQRKYRLSYHTL